jgi:hypothetical protein
LYELKKEVENEHKYLFIISLFRTHNIS